MNSWKPATVDEITPEACWSLLERVAQSSSFEPAARLRELLLYIGRRCIQEGCTQLREQEIGCAVFGRRDGYDTGSDNIVRTNISHLRKRIEIYFSTEGIGEPLILEIPRGSYVPVFTLRSSFVPPERTVETPSLPPPIESDRWKAVLPLLIVLCICALVIGIQYFVNRQAVHEMESRLSPWKSQPTLAEFWSNFYDRAADTDIVLSDTSFLLFEGIANRTYPLNAYIDRTFTNDIKSPDFSQDVRNALGTVALKNLGNSDEFRLAQRLLSLDPANGRVHIYNAREYSVTNLNQHNAILIGSPVADPWVMMFNNQLTFTSESRIDHNLVEMSILNHAPGVGEQRVYTPQNDAVSGVQTGYCIVALLPAPQHNGKVLLIEGTTSEANEAAASLLLSDAQLASLKSRMHVTNFPYFEVLLKTSQVRSMPLTFAIAAYRTYRDVQ